MLDVLRSAPMSSPSLLPGEDLDNDIFSTPPTTPMNPFSSAPSRPSGASGPSAADVQVSNCKPSLSRRSSRPSSLLLDMDNSQKWTPNVQLDAGSPDVRRDGADGNKLTDKDHHSASSPTPIINHNSHELEPPRSQLTLPAQSSTSAPQSQVYKQEIPGASTNNINSGPLLMSSGASTTETPSAGSSTVTQRHYSPSAAASEHPTPSHQKQHSLSLKSPCFVHSFLDKGASLADWLKSKQNTMMGVPSPLSQETASPDTYSNARIPTPYTNEIKHPRPQHHYVQATHPAMPLPQPQYSPASTPDSEDEDAASLTRQLAETAVGVREMSKQLGESLLRWLYAFRRIVSVLSLRSI